MAQEVKFLYNAMPALGGGLATAGFALPATPSSLASEVTRRQSDDAAERDPAVSDTKGARVDPSKGRDASGGELADEDQPFSIFGDFTSLDIPADEPQPGVEADAAAAETAAEQAIERVDEEAAAAAQAAHTADGELPWTRASSRIRSPLLRLHNEIAEFCRFLEPTPDEDAARRAAMQRVSDVVTALWPTANVEVFGSFATGLYLPTSDMDLVVTESHCLDVRSGLRLLAQALARKGMAKNIQVVAKARVPIIKFEEMPSGFNFDVSFDVANGPVTAAYVKELMAKLPPMRPLLFILKIFLQQREMNEVYSGGIGSYALLVMVAAFLQSHPSRAPVSAHSRAASQLEGSIGVLLVDFFRLFGRSLHCEYVGVSCRKGANFFDKRSRGHYQYERPYMLAVEDPNDPENDLAKGSYNASRVRQAFEYAYTQLVRGGGREESLLERVIRLDSVLVDRPKPAALPDYVSAPAQAIGSSDSELEAGEAEEDEGDLPELHQVESKKQRRRREEAEKKVARQNKKAKQKRKRVRERDVAYGDVDDGYSSDDAPPPGKLRRHVEMEHSPHDAYRKGSRGTGQQAPKVLGNSSGSGKNSSHRESSHSQRHHSHKHKHSHRSGSKDTSHGGGKSRSHRRGSSQHLRFD